MRFLRLTRGRPLLPRPLQTHQSAAGDTAAGERSSGWGGRASADWREREEVAGDIKITHHAVRSR